MDCRNKSGNDNLDYFVDWYLLKTASTSASVANSPRAEPARREAFETIVEMMGDGDVDDFTPVA